MPPRLARGMRVLPLVAFALLASGCLGGEPWLDVWVAYEGDLTPYRKVPVRLKTLALHAGGEKVDVGSDWTLDLAEVGHGVAWRGGKPSGKLEGAEALTASTELTLRDGRVVPLPPTALEWTPDGAEPWFQVAVERQPDGRYLLQQVR